MNNPDAPVESPPEKHDEFWFSDGSIVLRAENVLFKVHRGVLARQSELFKTMFEGCTPGADHEGSEARPLFLPEVASTPFAHLLHVVYGPLGGYLPHRLSKSKAALVAVVRLAHRLQFAKACYVAAHAAERRLTHFGRLGLALACGFDDWAYPAFKEAVLSFDDGISQLGGILSHDTYVNVLIARQRISAARSLFMLQQPASRASAIASGRAFAIAHIVHNTAREQFQLACMEIRGQVPGLNFTVTQQEFESWVPTPASEDEIIKDVWLTLQKGPMPANNPTVVDVPDDDE